MEKKIEKEITESELIKLLDKLEDNKIVCVELGKDSVSDEGESI